MKRIFWILFLINLKKWAISQHSTINCQLSLNEAGACKIDLNCANWLPQHFQENISRSVVKIYISRTISSNLCNECTGTLLAQRNVNANDFKPYILTARHCLVKQGGELYSEQELANAYIVFNYQRSGCNQPIPGENDPYIATELNQVKGERYFKKEVRLIDQSTLADFALLEITTPIPPHYKPYYAGWSTSPLSTFNPPFYGIHHPRGDVKSVSRTYNVSHDFFIYLS